MITVLVLTSLALVFQILMWLWLIGPLLQFERKNLKNNPLHILPPVSVIVCTNKNSEFLLKIIQHLKDQNYPSYEILFIINRNESTFNEGLLKEFMTVINIRILYSDNNKPGKKNALLKGIQESLYDWVLLTDDDCEPASKNWILKMMNETNGQTKPMFVLGYSPYRKESGILNLFCRFENTMNSLNMFSTAIRITPTSSTGRNLLYHKSLFRFENMKPEIPFGDDDLLVNSTANLNNTAICLEPESFVYTDAKKTWKDYILQKHRHYCASKYYTTKSKIILSVISLIQIAFYLLVLFSTFFISFQYVVLIYMIRMGFAWLVFHKITKILKSPVPSKYFPLLEPLYLISLVLQSVLMIRNPRQW